MWLLAHLAVLFDFQGELLGFDKPRTRLVVGRGVQENCPNRQTNPIRTEPFYLVWFLQSISELWSRIIKNC